MNKKIRQLVFERENGLCMRCGKPGTNIRHRIPRGIGRTRDPKVHAPANLILLCGSGTTGCHGWIERNRALAHSSGLLLSKWDTPEHQPIFHNNEAIFLFNNGDKKKLTRDEGES